CDWRDGFWETGVALAWYRPLSQMAADLSGPRIVQSLQGVVFIVPMNRSEPQPVPNRLALLGAQAKLSAKFLSPVRLPTAYRRKTMSNRISLCLALAASLNLANAENWPAWRGPRGDGTSLESHVPVHWGAASSIAWKTQLPGNGHASPIVWRDRLFTVTALLDSQDRALLCLDRATLRCRDRQIALAGEDGRAPRLIGLGQRAGLFSQRR